MEENLCSECGKKLVEDYKEIYCKECGLVDGEKVDMGIVNNFDKEEGRIIISKPVIMGQPLEPTHIGKYRSRRK